MTITAQFYYLSVCVNPRCQVVYAVHPTVVPVQGKLSHGYCPPCLEKAKAKIVKVDK